METINVSLSTITLGDKWSENVKNICKVIHNLNYSKDEVKAYVGGMVLKSKLDKFIHVKLIDSFQLHDEFISALVSEDADLISQLLKCHWFFKDDTNLLCDAEKFVDEIFSQISVLTRSRILKMYGRYLRDHKKADALFKVMFQSYGVKSVLNLLPACRKETIASILYDVNKGQLKQNSFPQEVLMQLYLYHPELLLDYLVDYFKFRKEGKFFELEYSSILFRLASKNPAKFVDIFDEYGKFIQMERCGKSLTKKLIKTNFDSILKNADEYCNIFKLKVLVSSLSSSQLEEFNLSLMPKTVKNLLDDTSVYIECRKPYLKMFKYMHNTFAKELFLKNFRRKYAINPLTVEPSISFDFVEYLPKAERISWAKTKLEDNKQKDEDKVKFAAYLDFDEAFVTLEKMVPLALEADGRRDILQAMCDCVKINQCTGEISKIFSFVTSRFRNEVPFVKGLVLREAARDYDLLSLSIEQWNPILDLINNLKANNELDQFPSEFISIYQKWVQKRLSAGLPADSELNSLLESYVYNYDFNFAINTPHGHFILCWFNEHLSNKEFSNNREKENFTVHLFCSICKWNSKYPKNKIEIKQRILDIVVQSMKKSHHSCDIESTLKYDPMIKSTLYEAVFPDVCTPMILLYKLKNKIQDIVDSVEIVHKSITDEILHKVKLYKFFFRSTLYYSSSNLVEKFVSLSKATLNSEDSSSGEKQASIVILSYLLDPPEFLSVMEKYLPSTTKADFDNNENRTLYRLQEVIASQLSMLNPSSSAIPAMLKYSKGDYLKMIIGSLNKIILNTPGSKALVFLNANLHTSVSYRKHILRLYKQVAPVQEICKVFSSPLATEKNLSMRKLLYDQAFKLFQDDQNDCTWKALGEALGYLNVDDLKKIQSFFYYSSVPEDYLYHYLEVLWSSIDRLKDSYDCRQRIFIFINDKTINRISEEFSDTLLSLCYPELSNDDHHWSQYIGQYLFKISDVDGALRTSKVMTKVKSSICLKWDTIDEKTAEMPAQQAFSRVVAAVCYHSTNCADQLRANQVLKAFQCGLLLLIPEEEAVSDYFNISLHLSLNKLRGQENKFSLMCHEICDLVDKISSSFQNEIVIMLADNIRNFLEANFRIVDENSNYNLFKYIHAILDSSVSRINKMIALKLINCIVLHEDDIPKYIDLIRKVLSLSDKKLVLYAKHVVLKK